MMNKFLGILRKPEQKEVKAFTSWANEHAIIINPLDGLNTDIEKFSCLDPFLEGKRVIYLGEEDHWIHEKSDYRLLLLTSGVPLLEDEMDIAGIYNAVFRTQIAKQADAIFLLEK